MGRSGGQRTGPFRLPLASASQAKKRGGCVRRWGFARLEGRKEPQGKNAILGTNDHSEMEGWNRFGILPLTKETCAALKFSPAPGIAEVEVPVRFDTWCEDAITDGEGHYWPGVVPWVGYIDLAYDWEFGDTVNKVFVPRHDVLMGAQDAPKVWASANYSGRPAPLGSTGITVIHDWKFSSSTDWAMTPEQLEADWAANIYAHEAFEGGAQRVLCRWVYTAFGGGTPKEVWCEMTREGVAEVLRELHALMALALIDRARYLDGDLKVMDLPIDISKCFEYKQECPFKGDCKPERPPTARIQMKRSIGMSEAFENHMNDVAPKKAPPPPPPKKGPPPPPPKKTGTPAIETPLGAPESGTINPPGGPTTAAASPEEAKKLQGIADKPEPVKDELDGMELHQLKALATAIGAEFLPRARNASVIAAIRARRAEMAASGEVITDLDSGAADEKFEKEVAEATASMKAAMAKEEETLTKERIAELNSDSIAEAVRICKLTTEELVQEDATMRKAAGFKLFINCLPTSPYTTVSSFVAGLMADFKTATECDDYRQVEFGKGLGMMAASIVDELENGRYPAAIVCDTRTQEGFAFCATFERFASSVVRGF